MKSISFLDQIQMIFLCIANKNCKNSVSEDELSVDYGQSLEFLLSKYLRLAEESAQLLSCAKDKNDELAMQSALLTLRCHFMSLSSLFSDVADDVEVLLMTGDWPEIPDNYQVPDF